MHLEEIIPGAWTISALVDASGKCEVLSYLDELQSTNKKSEVARIFAKLELLAQHGPNYFKPNAFHSIDDGIYQLSIGRHRISCFFSGAKVIICAAADYKQTKKTEKKYKNRSKKAIEAYKQGIGK